MDPELLEQFLLEGRDLVARATEDLSALQGGAAAAPEQLDGLFRSLHTLKGSTAVFDLPDLTTLLHAAETGLEAARQAQRLEPASARGLLRALDLSEAWMDVLEQGATPPSRLIDDTRRAQGAFGADAGASPAASDVAHDDVPAWARALASTAGVGAPLVAIRYLPAPDAYFRGDDPAALFRNVPGLMALEATAPPADPQGVYDPFQCTLQFHALSSAAPDDVRAAFRLVSDQVELVAVLGEPEGRAADTLLRTLRVDASRLDVIAALVDELVIAKNTLLHTRSASGVRGREDAGAEAALERAVATLHAAVTDLRLTPLQAVFSRFPRQVREVAAEVGKTVAFEMRGERVVLDKAVVEGLYEPLLHLIRNALDHGLESPDLRARAGKPPEGRLSLIAEARGGEVEIRLEDDGRGVDVDRVRGLAVERGVVTLEQAGAMDDGDAARLIFAPGFSTAAQVSALSGRGVGMDAVRAAVERMGGRIELVNRPGRGLTVTLVLPANVMLTRALTVTAGGQRFGAAIATIGETHRVRRDEVTAIRAGRAYVRRDKVIPLLRLGELLGAAAEPDAPTFPVLTIETPDGPVGLQVEALGEQIEAPLRPLGGLLSRFPGMLGTILEGDGGVLLVLDLQALAA